MKRKHLISQTVAAALILATPCAVAVATEKQIADLETEIGTLNEKIAATGASGDAVSLLLSNIDSAKKEIAATKEAVGEKEKQIAGKEILLGIYQQAFRVVTTLTPGQNLGVLTLRTGERIDSSSFVSISNGSVLVQTTTGSRSIPIAQLPDNLAAQITMPPAVIPLANTLASVKSGKPEALKTDSDRAAVVESSVASSGGAGKAATAASPPETGVENDQAIGARNSERMRQISELKIQFSSLYTQKRIAREEKASAEKIFREAKIKKSASETSATLRMYDDKLKRLELEELAVREKIAKLQSAME